MNIDETTNSHRSSLFARAALGAVVALSLAACSATPATSTPGGETPASDDRRPKLAGHWKSACTKTGEAQSIALDFDITEDDWKLDYTTYGDAACANAFVTVHVEGDYAIASPSDDIPGAFRARFGFSKKTLTPHGDAAAAFAASDKACGGGEFHADRATDITERGCPGLGQYPVPQCSADFDLVAVDGDALRFGDRPKDNDMCTEAKRPTALASLTMARVK